MIIKTNDIITPSNKRIDKADPIKPAEPVTKTFMNYSVQILIIVNIWLI